MKTTIRHISCSLLPYLLIGCESSTPRSTRMEAPSLEQSRSALIASLDAWKGGHRKAGGWIEGKPAVGTNDSLRPERPLFDYKMDGALGTVDNARAFSVTLELDTPREIVNARYLVLGQDPLWVFRQEDFEMILHWEHKMDRPTPEPTPATAAVPASTASNYKK